MVESIKELRRICQKSREAPKPETTFFRNKMWVAVSIYITKLLLYTNITANQVTFIMVSLGFAAAFFFAFGNYWYSIIGALLLEFSWLLDAVDGEIARYRNFSSLNGVFLDLISHFTNLALPFMGVAIGLYILNPSFKILVLGLSTCIFLAGILDIQPLKHHVILVNLINHAKNKQFLSSKQSLPSRKNVKIRYGVLKKIFNNLINPFYDHLLIMHILLFAAIFNKLYWALVFYGLTCPIIWIIKFIHEYRIGTEVYDFLLKPYKK